MIRNTSQAMTGRSIITIFIALSFWCMSICFAGSCLKMTPLSQEIHGAYNSNSLSVKCGNHDTDHGAPHSTFNHHHCVGICCSSIKAASDSIPANSGSQIEQLNPEITISHILYAPRLLQAVVCAGWISAWSSTAPPLHLS